MCNIRSVYGCVNLPIKKVKYPSVTSQSLRSDEKQKSNTQSKLSPIAEYFVLKMNRNDEFNKPFKM